MQYVMGRLAECESLTDLLFCRAAQVRVISRYPSGATLKIIPSLRLRRSAVQENSGSLSANRVYISISFTGR